MYIEQSDKQIMEQETFFSEKSSIHKNYKKYGTTNKRNQQQQEVLVRHDLSKTDTLQGIALKYGCSVSTLTVVSVSYDRTFHSFCISQFTSIISRRWNKFEGQIDSLQTTVSFFASS